MGRKPVNECETVAIMKAIKRKLKDKGSKDPNSSNFGNEFLDYIISSYGGITSIVGNIYKGLNVIPMFRKNKYLSSFNKAFSFGMIGYDFYTKFKTYYHNKVASVGDLKNNVAREILEKHPHGDEYLRSWTYNDYEFEADRVSWLLNATNDDLDGIIVKSYYDMDTGEELTSLPMECSFAMLLIYEDVYYLMEFKQLKFTATSHITFDAVFCMGDDAFGSLFEHIFAKYMKHIGYDKNVLHFNGYNIETRPRSKANNIIVDTIDIDSLTSNMINILEHRQRRGYIFVGKPGTGKTTILLKIEHDLTAYPIVYATASNLSDEYSIGKLSRFIKNIGKCVVLIEDMDSLEINRKTTKIAPLLELLDNSRSTSSVIFIATINDSGLITNSIARAGRFDEIVEIHAPKTDASIYNVFKSAWNRYASSVEFINMDDISKFTYFRMKMHKFTQADYCEIVHKIIIDGDTCNNDTLIKSMKNLLKSKKTFSKFKKESQEQ